MKAVYVNLQPYSDLPKDQLQIVHRELKKIYPYIRIKPSISLPASAFYKPRSRYRADSLIRMLSSGTQAGEVTVGLTTKDISTTKNNVADWGVMGLGYIPGRACVASGFRLNPEQRDQQFFKVAIHEIGHTQGLEHCPEKSCFMRDAEGKNHTNEETDFCLTCKEKLKKQGWEFNP